MAESEKLRLYIRHWVWKLKNKNTKVMLGLRYFYMFAAVYIHKNMKNKYHNSFCKIIY
jgi:hypothetical protein